MSCSCFSLNLLLRKDASGDGDAGIERFFHTDVKPGIDGARNEDRGNKVDEDAWNQRESCCGKCESAGEVRAEFLVAQTLPKAQRHCRHDGKKYDGDCPVDDEQNREPALKKR